ncbi:MAG: glycyl-tRNA synthetase, alpha subunit, partial [Candidatus Aminicenantes bacterium]|nr:glycyl-tRNA synthetase, alpha subunit [Candidatus Aminicenantes bacterium]
AASVTMLRQAFGACQKEAARLIAKDLLLPAYDMSLKCSHNFNLLDSRGAISVTERIKMISQIRALVNEIARKYTGGKEGA